MNKALRVLILSDLFILSSFGLISPIFSIFIIKQIPDATIASAGMAITIQMFTKAILQIIVGKWTDEEKGNCRELYSMLAGSLLISIVPLGYILCKTIAGLYLIQIMYGLGQALAYPSWKVLFNRYLNQDRAGYEFSIYDTVVGLGIASAAAIGGYIANTYSFTPLFIAVSTVSFLGAGLLVYIFKEECTCRIHLPVSAELKLKYGHHTSRHAVKNFK